MADQLVKISSLDTVSGAAATGSDLIPIVDSSNTKAISLTQLTSYLTNQGLGASVTTNNNTYTVTGGGGGSFYEKRYYRSNAVPSTPPDTPYPPSGWSTAVPAGNQVLWSTIALINAARTGLDTGHWSAPVREGAGQVIFYQGTEPAAAYIQEGDIWYNTSDNNKIYRYIGTYGAGGSWSAVFTPFPGIDTSGNIVGLVQATGSKSTFALLASNFQIIDPADPTNANSKAIVPFEVDGGEVYMNGAHIRNLDAGVITGGEITAAISLQSPTINAGKVNNSSAVFNNDNPNLTMPAICWDRSEIGDPYSISGGPDNSSGDVNWLLDFYGWQNSTGGAFSLKRFGKNTMIFNYSFEGYASDNFNSINLNVVFQVDSGTVTQAQGPQADTASGALRLSQAGSVIIEGLTGTEHIRFGYRAAKQRGTGTITYSLLTVTGFNI